MSDQRMGRPEGFFPFLAVASLGQLTLGWPFATVDRPEFAALATAAFGVTIAAALLIIRRGTDPRLAVVPAYLFFLVVALWMHADGGARSGFAIMLALPVLWLALHGTLTQVWFAVVCVGAVLVTPMLLLGAPDYPASDWRRAVLSMAVAALLGPLTNTLVRQLASQRELYALLISHLPATTVGLVGRDLTWVNVTGRYLGEAGLQSEEFVGREVGATIAPESAPELHALLRSAFDGPVTGVIESFPGTWFEVDAMPIQDSTRRELVMMVARDITARYLAERERATLHEAVLVSEERFRTIFEIAPNGIAITSSDGADAGRFIRVNDAFARMLGRDRSDLEGRLITDVTHPDDLDLTTRVLEGGERGLLEKRYLHSSGRSVWAEVSYTMLSDPDRPGRYSLSQVEDVTTRKASERALLDALGQQQAATEALQKADAVRREVVSTVSHEVRTPLTSITGYLELLSDGSAGPLTEQQASMLEVIGRNTARLQGLVDDLLLLSRAERAPRIRPSAVEVRLDEVVRSEVESLRPLAAQRGQRLDLRDEATPIVVLGDREQLDRAVANLLSNATKYTREGGEISVSLATAAGRAVLRIADTGIGIPESEQDRLFDRFFRASTAAESGAPGTGLGLAIVKSLVELNGGRVDVESEPGRGSVFTIDLPLAPAPRTPAQAP
jgi:PAS domain S-box-containing protein